MPDCTTAEPQSSPPETLIAPRQKGIPLSVREIWQFRELLWAFSLRTFKVRYKQTAVGVIWSVLKPLITASILTVVFQYILKTGSGYLRIYAGVLPWTFFSNTLTQNTFSLVTNSPVLTKVYFPRIILPLSSYFAAAIDFIIAFAIFMLLILFSGEYPGPGILLIPLLILVAGGFSFGVGLIFAVLNVRFRDVQFIVPFLLQLGLFISPVAYESHRQLADLDPLYRLLYALNPMVGVIDGFRWAMFSDSPFPNPISFCLSLLLIAALFAFGLWFFCRMERRFADEI